MVHTELHGVVVRLPLKKNFSGSDFILHNSCVLHKVVVMETTRIRSPEVYR